LPGLSGGWFSAPPLAPLAPPARVTDDTGAAAERGGPRNGGGLDFWLLDKLFGRR